MPRIFISYRRDDTEAVAGRLYDALRSRFGRDRVFRDIDTLRGGQDYTVAIERVIQSSDVVLVLIGGRWLKAADDMGRRRLDDPEDVLAREIASALAHGKTTIPVRVQGSPMPQRSELPVSLADLALRNAVELSDSRWDYDVSRIVKEIGLPWYRRVLDRPVPVVAGVVFVLATILAGTVLLPQRLNPEAPATLVPATAIVSTRLSTIDPTAQAVFLSSTPASMRIFNSATLLSAERPDPQKLNQQAAMTFAWMLQTLDYHITWHELNDLLAANLSEKFGVADSAALEAIATELHDGLHLPAFSVPGVTYEFVSGRAGRQPIVICGVQQIRQCVGIRTASATGLELVNPDPNLGLGTSLGKADFSRWGQFDAVLLDAVAPAATQNAPVPPTPTVPPKPSPTVLPTARPTPNPAAVRPTKPYNASAPSVIQKFSWDDSAAATAWPLQSLGVDASQDDVINWLGPSKLNSSFGLMNGSGADVAALLTDLTGKKTDAAFIKTFDEVVALAMKGPVLLGAHGMYHWMGVRGASDDGTKLLLANPSPGYNGVGEEFSSDLFQRFGPYSVVSIDLS